MIFQTYTLPFYPQITDMVSVAVRHFTDPIARGNFHKKNLEESMPVYFKQTV